jgi:hypothetical protein
MWRRLSSGIPIPLDLAFIARISSHRTVGACRRVGRVIQVGCLINIGGAIMAAAR